MTEGQRSLPRRLNSSSRLAVLFCAIVFVAGIQSAAVAQCIKYYGVVGHGSELYEFDPTDNWSATLIGDIELQNINAADFSAGGRLFVAGFDDEDTPVLAEIDPSNASVVGTYPLPEYTEAIAFDGNYCVYFVSEYCQIKRFNLCTEGVEVLPEPIGIDEVQAIDFTRDGRLFGISSHTGNHPYNELWEIDPCSGAGEAACRLQEESEDVPDINGLDIDARDRFHILTTFAGYVYRIDVNDNCTMIRLGETSFDYGALASVEVDCPGDINTDCVVDQADLGILLANWGMICR
jgi:hypothetical protein